MVAPINGQFMGVGVCGGGGWAKLNQLMVSLWGWGCVGVEDGQSLNTIAGCQKGGSKIKEGCLDGNLQNKVLA